MVKSWETRDRNEEEISFNYLWTWKEVHVGYFELNGEKKHKLNMRRGTLMGDLATWIWGTGACPGSEGVPGTGSAVAVRIPRLGSRAAEASSPPQWGAGSTAEDQTGQGAGWGNGFRRHPFPTGGLGDIVLSSPSTPMRHLLPKSEEGIRVSLAPRHRIRKVSCRKVLCGT